jgi:26S proteasome regulatory subunit T6
MATNCLDTLDLALLRPGQIDRKIFFPEPSLEAHANIFKIHSCKMNLTKDANLKKIAEKMPVTSGAEVKAVCTEAGMFALRERTHVTRKILNLLLQSYSIMICSAHALGCCKSGQPGNEYPESMEVIYIDGV